MIWVSLESLVVQWFIVRINLKTVCQDSFKDCQYYFKESILKNPDIFKKILTHFKKILTLFKKILTLFKKILTSPFVRIFVPHRFYNPVESSWGFVKTMNFNLIVKQSDSYSFIPHDLEHQRKYFASFSLRVN